jgi:hypothetical protein
MKKLILLLFLFPNIAFSQDSIKLPTHVAKSIIKDLIDYESVKAQLNLCNEQIKLLEQKINSKDSIITVYTQKMETCKSQIDLEKQKTDLYKESYEKLKKEYRRLKLKLTLNQIGAGVIIGTLTYFLIVK